MIDIRNFTKGPNKVSLVFISGRLKTRVKWYMEKKAKKSWIIKIRAGSWENEKVNGRKSKSWRGEEIIKRNQVLTQSFNSRKLRHNKSDYFRFG